MQSEYLNIDWVYDKKIFFLMVFFNSHGWSEQIHFSENEALRYRKYFESLQRLSFGIFGIVEELL